MKTAIFKSSLAILAMAAVMGSCSKEEVYDAPITRELSMTLDGEPYSIYYGTNNYPLFIYKDNGDFYANYNTSYRFSLPAGDYKLICTNQSKLMEIPTSLNDEVIEQDPECLQTFGISAPVSYTAGDPMKVDMFTRTGMLRLKAVDVKADKSYASVRTTLTTPVSGWSVGEGKPVNNGEPLELTRSKETSGGIGFTEDLYLIGSPDDEVTVNLEYLDADGNVIKSKAFDGGFKVNANEITEVTFELNNPDEPVIISYNVTVGQLKWREEEIYPSVKVDVPDGFTYIEPGGDINGILKEQLADTETSKIQLYLKAGSSYSISDKVIEEITKPLVILGQEPGFGQTKAELSVMNASMQGDLDEIRFQNLTIKPQRDRIFNLRTQKYHVGTLAFVNCDIDSWTGLIFTTAVSAADTQIIDNVVMDGCRLTNLTVTNPLWNCNKRNVGIKNWTFRNTLFHGRNFGTGTAILGNMAKVTAAVTVNVEGCTFLDPRGVTAAYFDLDGAAAASLDITVKDCVVGGAKTGTGTWFKLGKTTSVSASGNLRSKGYEMSAWGIDAPAESELTFEQYLSQFNIK